MPAGSCVRYVRRLALIAVASAAAPVFAEPPADRGPSDRGRSTVDRALDSRAGLADRARGASAERLDSQAGSTSSTTSIGPGSSLSSSARTHGLGVAAERSGRTSPQVGTGRVGRELQNARGLGRLDTSRAEVTLGRKSDAGGRPGLRFGWSELRKGRGLSPAAGTVDADAGNGGTVHLRGQRPDRVLSPADRFLAKRLAQIDRMRDEAVANDDADLLEQADKLEALARAQYTQKTTGEKTVGATMRAFNEERSGDSESDPEMEVSTRTDGEPAP